MVLKTSKRQGASAPWLRFLPAVASASLLLAVPNEIPDVDPAQYLDVAAWIHRSGDWLNLRDSLGPFINKPPLMMWLQAALMWVVGETDLVARMASLLFGAVLLVAIWGIGRELKDSARGVTAATFAACSVAFHSMVAEPKVDIALASMTAVSVLGFLRARRQPGWIWLGWGGAALAVLSKGPVGLAIVAVAIAPEGLRQVWGQGAGPMHRRVLAVRPIRGLLLLAAITAPFYVALGKAQGSGSVEFLLWQQGFGRLLGQSGYSNDTTPLFFLHTALWAFAPFTPLLLHGLWRRARTLWAARALPADENRIVLWWLLLPFIAISFATFKLPQYLYWLVAPAALLAAEELEHLSEVTQRRHTWGQWGLGLVLVGAAAVGTGLWPASTGVRLGWVVIPLVIFVLGALVSRRLAAPARLVTATAAATLGAFIWLHGFFEPVLLEYQPGREWGRIIRTEDPTGTVTPWQTGTYPMFSVGFYSGRRGVHTDAAEVRRMVDAKETSVALVTKGEYAALRQAGLEVEPVASLPSFPVSRLNAAFLMPSSRASTLTWHELVKLRVR
jgi:4-amino-4-deoxy-L-arabinose transferase-like glycosyltransferase